MGKLNIVHIITRMDMGGSAQNTMASCEGLTRWYDITLIYGTARESLMDAVEMAVVQTRLKQAERKGVKLMPLKTLLRRLHPVFDFLAFIEIIKVLRRLRPEIVHTHSSKAGFIGRLAALFSRVAVVVHTPHGHVFYGHFDRLASAVFLVIERWMDRCTDITVALTRGELDDYVRLRVSSRQKLTTIHSGVDISRFTRSIGEGSAKRQALGIPAAARIVGFIGWMLPIKGPDVLLNAMLEVWLEFPETHLVFVGKGEMQNELERRVRESRKANRVHFLGWQDDINNILPVFDLLVLPSRNEGMGRVLVEAMAAGKPVIGSNVGGIPDLIENGGNGLLFPSDNPEALAAAIGSVLGNPKKAKDMGQRGKLKSSEYSTEGMVEKLDALYRRLIEEKKVSLNS